MSEIAESSIVIDRPADVGANDVGAKRLMLPSPQALYRFDNVGAVFVISRADKARIVATFTGEDGRAVEVPIVVPGGNWLLVHVGAMPGVGAKPGFSKVDNPLPPCDGERAGG